MAFNYEELQDIAKQLILDTGRQVTIEKIDDTPSDPNKPWAGNAGTPEQASVTATIVPSEYLRSEEMGYVRGSQVALVAADSSLGDLTGFTTLVDANGFRWTISNIELIQPGSVQVLYTFELDK